MKLHSWTQLAINSPEIFDLRCLPANFFLLQATGLCPHLSFNVPSWSISAEMCLYVVAPAIFWVLRRNVAAVGGLAAAMILALTALNDPGRPWLNWAVTGAVRAVPSFLFGAWLYGMRRSVWTIPYASVGFWGGLLGFVVGCGLGLPLPGLLLLYLTVTFAVAADGRAAPPCRLVRWAAAGGQLTYSSYILHELLMTVIVTFGAEHVLHLHGTWKNAVVVLTFLLVWPVSYVSLFVFEKPLRRAIGARAGAPALGLGRLSALSVKPGREA